MIAVNHALKNPGLMIKHKDDLKDVEIFGYPWYHVFERHPYLYREFSDRFDEMSEWNIFRALTNDPTLILNLKDYLHKMGETDTSLTLREAPALTPGMEEYLHKIDGWAMGHLLGSHPELSLCIKHRNNPDKVEAAYYITFPHELNNINKEEKREMSKRIIELLREEKI